MKKIILSVLITTAVIDATFAEAPCSTFNGFYVGAGLNYITEKFNFKASFTPTGGVAKEENLSESLKGGGVKLFGGYGTTISQGFYLGGELALGYDRIIGDKNGKDLKSNNKLNYSIAGRLGYAISSLLPYVKFGYEGRPSINIEDFSIKRNGFILGGGADVAVAKNIFIRGEYLHGFGAKSNKSADVTIGGVAGTGALNVKTSSDTFLIGAAYKF
jgi:opacity protein-like surface antigen